MVPPMSQILKETTRKGKQVQTEMSADMGVGNLETNNVPDTFQVKPKQLRKTVPKKFLW